MGADRATAANWHARHDAAGNKVKETVSGRPGGSSAWTVHGVTQFSYDVLDRPLCQARRMNPAVFAALPANACALGTTGTAGPDRISKTLYCDPSVAGAATICAWGKPWKQFRALNVTTANGFAENLQQVYALSTWNANGTQRSLTDANGNRSDYDYDGFDRLTDWLFPSKTVPGQVNPADYEHYTYDANGNRLSLRKRSGQTINFTYDALNRMLAEYSGTGALLRRYVHGPGVDEPVLWYEGTGSATRRFFHADAQGSVVAVSDATGLASEIHSYGPYGEPEGTTGSRFRYTGQIILPELGLYHYKARAYSPWLGRFLQTDPIGYKDDNNLYAYVGNDPGNKSDPTGEAGWRETHFGRNSLNHPPKSQAGAIRKGWIKLQPEQSIFHKLGTNSSKNEKYISPDGKQEAVYDENGNLVTSEENKGTYNFSDPISSPASHIINDVLPYWIWGNSPKDRTSAVERISACSIGACNFTQPSSLPKIGIIIIDDSSQNPPPPPPLPPEMPK